MRITAIGLVDDEDGSAPLVVKQLEGRKASETLTVITSSISSSSCRGLALSSTDIFNTCRITQSSLALSLGHKHLERHGHNGNPTTFCMPCVFWVWGCCCTGILHDD